MDEACARSGRAPGGLTFAPVVRDDVCSGDIACAKGGRWRPRSNQALRWLMSSTMARDVLRAACGSRDVAAQSDSSSISRGQRRQGPRQTPSTTEVRQTVSTKGGWVGGSVGGVLAACPQRSSQISILPQREAPSSERRATPPTPTPTPHVAFLAVAAPRVTCRALQQGRGQ